MSTKWEPTGRIHAEPMAVRDSIIVEVAKGLDNNVVEVWDIVMGQITGEPDVG